MALIPSWSVKRTDDLVVFTLDDRPVQLPPAVAAMIGRALLSAAERPPASAPANDKN
jgi:hypothetical protein